ncbi:MAG TPA: universal stress protein [Gaiellaceae bacterium]|nr:universal stress protein [Gaiellaceae bacterium]
MFDRIVVGVDDTPESLEAARQAAVLRVPEGALHLLAVAETTKAAHAGFLAGAAAEQLLTDARVALERATDAVEPTTSALLTGRPAPALLERMRRHGATLLVLGCHERRRSPGLAFGAVGSVLLREAPCSVLVARRDSWPEGYPERIVVGVDGSPASVRAVEVARSVCDRFGSRLTLVVALGGKLREATAVIRAYPDAVVEDRAPVDALVSASRSADLVVVGSRGLHGLRALGSVSERVAHRAHASVLVVRER